MSTDITTITFNDGELKAQDPTANTHVSNKKYVDDVGNTKVAKTDIVDNLTSTDNTKVLAASQGKVLGDQIAALSGSLVFQGTLNASGSPTQLDNAQVGWFWLVDTAGTLLGQSLGVGDEIYCDTTVVGTPTDFSSFQAIPSAQGILRVENGQVDFLNSLAKNIEFGNVYSSNNSAIRAVGDNNSDACNIYRAYFGNFSLSPQSFSLKARGSEASPSAILQNDSLKEDYIIGIGSSEAHISGVIKWIASENWTDISNGTTYQINKTKTGNSSTDLAFELDANNNANFKENMVIDGTIQIKGGNPDVNKVLTSTDINGLAQWENKPEQIVKRRFAILNIGVNSSGNTKAVSFNFNTVFGEDFGNDVSKINIQLTSILNFDADDMISCLIRDITVTGFDVNSYRIDSFGGTWGADVTVSCTVTQLI